MRGLRNSGIFAGSGDLARIWHCLLRYQERVSTVGSHSSIDPGVCICKCLKPKGQEPELLRHSLYRMCRVAIT